MRGIVECMQRSPGLTSAEGPVTKHIRDPLPSPPPHPHLLSDQRDV